MNKFVCFVILSVFSTGFSYCQVATSVSVSNTRSVGSFPFNYAREVEFEFKDRALIGLPGSSLWAGLFTFAPWSDNSGGPHHQMGFMDSSIYYRTGLPQTATWTTWKQFIIANGTGNVGIGTDNPGFKLDVIGTIRAREVKVDMSGADFVFEEDYGLMPLPELEAFIKANKHLPEIESAAEMEAEGVELGEFNSKLLQKIEELTLYLLIQDKQIELLKDENKQLKDLDSRIRILEGQSN